MPLGDYIQRRLQFSKRIATRALFLRDALKWFIREGICHERASRVRLVALEKSEHWPGHTKFK